MGNPDPSPSGINIPWGRSNDLTVVGQTGKRQQGLR